MLSLAALTDCYCKLKQQVSNLVIPPDLTSQLNTLQSKVESQTRLIYRYEPAAEPGLRARWWGPDAGPHTNPDDWAGPADFNGFPLPVATAPDFDVVSNSSNVNATTLIPESRDLFFLAIVVVDLLPKLLEATMLILLELTEHFLTRLRSKLDGPVCIVLSLISQPLVV